MIKGVGDLSLEERKISFLQGTSFAMYEANIDKKNYINYKKGETKELSESVMKSMEILEILEKLGYSLDELGTFFYKDVIAEVYEKLKDVSSRNDMQKCRELMSELTDSFSSFYFYIAREWKEVGVKPFHLFIQQAISRIDDKAIDIELSKKIFGENPEESNYGLQAFQIAAYVANKYSYEDVKDYKKPLVKKLSNMPEDIKLKDNLI